MEIGMKLPEDCWKGVEEAGVRELESRGGQLGGVRAGAGEEDFVCHLSESEAEGKGWDGEKGRPMEMGGQRSGELLVRQWVGGGDVDGSSDLLRIEQEEDGGQGVWHGDPAHVLTTVAELAAEAEAEEGEHTGEGATRVIADDNAEPQKEHADAGVNRGFCRGFPLAAKIGEEADAERGGFVDEFAAAIAVNAGGRSNKQCFGRLAKAGEGGGECAG